MVQQMWIPILIGLIVLIVGSAYPPFQSNVNSSGGNDSCDAEPLSQTALPLP